VNEDRRPDIQQAGGTGPRTDIVESNQHHHQDAIRPLARPRPASGVDNNMQDRKSDILPVARLGANAGGGAAHGARSQRSAVPLAAKLRNDPEPIQAAQDPVAIGQDLARLSVGPQLADTSLGRALDESQDRKPDITETGGRSPTVKPEQVILLKIQMAMTIGGKDKQPSSRKYKIITMISRSVRSVRRSTSSRSAYVQMAIKNLKRELRGQGKAGKGASVDEAGSLPEPDHSDGDDDSWKAQAAIIKDIQKHYAEIESQQASSTISFQMPC
jgi:hypothetical protein